MKQLSVAGKNVTIYEPGLDKEYLGIPVIKDLNEFISRNDMIVANRISDDLSSCKFKVYCRDIFGKD